MNIVAQLHGRLCALTGATHLPLSLPDDATVAIAIAQLQRQLPADAASLLARSACALGDAIAPRATPLQDGQTLAVLPPVSGG